MSRNIAFSKKSRIAFHNAPPPLPHNLRRDCPFILVGKITDLPAKMIKSVLDGIGGYGEEDLKEGVDWVLWILHVTDDFGCCLKKFRKGSPTLGNTGNLF